ncbi:hypothetical protein C7B82_25550 [Stenomitos frigidus ULC18]|uniref:TonB C-terminal domain-containing protein n=1 Tax=Stenomitos frigidus ULC18 TaxID=2107698 RepID=A0A2T1DWA8_9CYAN|nr:hypothetical protein C7B82_25550 [Stenomitos frigidus ULC18]
MALRQPFSIAVLASVGVHGLLWAALPNFLAETEKIPDTKQRVQTVELSPAEQSQLPQFGINPIPQTLTPAKPSKPAQSATKLPDPKLYNDPSLYNFPILEPPPPIVFPLLGLPPGLDFKLPPIKKTPSKPPADQAIKPPKSPEKTEPKKTDADTPKTPVDPTAPARLDKLSPEQLTALRQQGERLGQLRTLYTFNGPDTKEKAGGVFQANATTFIDLAKKITGGNADDSRLKTPERVTGVFPKEACPFVRGFRNASFAAIVKPDGTLAEPPTVLLTTGFKGLDNAAIDDITSSVKNKKFGDGSKFQLIRFDFIFDPKTSCSASDKRA